MSATTQCPHSDLHFNLNNACIGDTNLHYLEIKCNCSICGTDMIFPGWPVGMSPDHPAVSPDGKELRIPFLGEGETRDGNPVGFIIRARP